MHTEEPNEVGRSCPKASKIKWGEPMLGMNKIDNVYD